MSIGIPKVEFSYYIRIFCVYYRYVKPERKSFSEEEKNFNNTIIDSIITMGWIDGCYLYLFIYTFRIGYKGWLLCTCHSPKTMLRKRCVCFLFCSMIYTKILLKYIETFTEFRAVTDRHRHIQFIYSVAGFGY